MATCSSFPTCEIPVTEKPGGLQSTGVVKVLDTTYYLNKNKHKSKSTGWTIQLLLWKYYIENLMHKKAHDSPIPPPPLLHLVDKRLN